MKVVCLKPGLYLFVLLFLLACSNPNSKKQASSEPETISLQAPEDATLLFDGKTMDGWEITKFGTEGPVRINEGKLIVNMGDGASGITWQKDFPKVNYEVQLEAMKTVGNDFFCGMTFPVNDEYCSLIVGGWGGPVVGLSCIDGLDASENETHILKRFDKDVWYKIKLEVDDNSIRAWIDEEKLVDFTYTGRKLSTRPEVDLSKPFGICTWNTTAELRNFWMRELGE